jgi:NAD(P)-dependent dehydrogenase (short-subunit alcohol dehydrogenase family)
MQATTSKVWLITGASRGLGRAFTEAALEAGHQVVATARNPQQLGTIVGKYGGRVRAVALDVTNEAQAIAPIGRAPYAAAKFGVEGFSESLYNEVGPLGIKVTLAEPGGFRTDFAGSSTALCEGRSEYDATVGTTVRFQRDYDRKQPGDPAKAAAALLHISSLSEPPLRLLLGSDSYNAAEQAALQKLE